MSPPKVSVGVPVLNGGRYLRQALDSVLRQDFDDFEVLISDNCSTDDTSDICRGYAATDRRVQVIQQPTRREMFHNFVEPLRRARGEYFIWLAHDDFWADGFLSAVKAELESSPTLTAAFSLVRTVDEAGQPLGVVDLGILDARPPRSMYEATLAYARFGKDYHTYGLFLRTHLQKCLRHLLQQHPYFIKHSIYAGGVFTHSLVLEGAFAIVPKPLFNYRVHHASFSHAGWHTRRMWLFHLHYSLRCLALYARQAPIRFGLVRGTHIFYKVAKIHWRALWKLARAVV